MDAQPGACPSSTTRNTSYLEVNPGVRDLRRPPGALPSFLHHLE